MKNFLTLLLFSMIFSLGSFASQEHLAVNLKKDGAKNILMAVFDNYQKSDNPSEISLPAGSIHHIFSKENIQSNPIIQNLKKLVFFKMKKDLSVHTRWEKILFESKVDKESIEFISSGTGRDFKMILKVDLTELDITGSKIEFCEVLNKKDNEDVCNEDSGFYGRFENFKLSLNPGQRIKALIETSVQVTNQNVVMRFVRIISNLSGKKSNDELKTLKQFSIMDIAPKFSLAFDEFYMPPPILTIGKKKFPVKVDKIRDALLDESDFLANSLTGFAGDFVAKDLIEIANTTVFEKLDNIGKVFRILNYDRNKAYYKKMIKILDEKGPKRLVTYMMASENDDEKQSREITPAQRIQKVIQGVVYNAKYDVSFKELSIDRGRSMTAHLGTVLEVNKKRNVILDKVWNGEKKLKPVNFKEVNGDYDFAVAVSEPIMNSMFGLASKTHIIKSAFHELVGIKGVQLGNINVHLKSNAKSCSFDSFIVVAQVLVDLGELENEGTWSGIKNSIGSFLEGKFSSNSHTTNSLWFESGKIWFPIEIEVNAVLENIVENGVEKNYINLITNSPFTAGELKNSFNYPVKNMNSMVKDALYDTLRESMGTSLFEINRIDISPFIHAIPGLRTKPKGLFATNSGHLVLSFDIEQINLKDFGGSNE